MSSTNRGAERRTDDAYMAPAWCVRRLLEVWRPRDGIKVEPAAGTGNIVRAVGGDDWRTYDIQPVPAGAAILPGNHATVDFLQFSAHLCDTFVFSVITNPPYSLAEEFIRACRDAYPCADLVFLLRIAFLASAGRLPLWQDLGTPDLYVLPNRPSFTGSGTDSADYAWFRWTVEQRDHGDVRVLGETPKAERCR